MTAWVIGKFDALHRGHRELVRVAAGLGEPGILSFSGMAEVLGWPPRKPLLGKSERERVLRDWQVAQVCALPFAELRELSPAAFVELLVQEHGATAIVTGADFRFGRDRAGDVSILAELARGHGITVRAVEPVQVAGRPASSSRVRDAIAAGDVVDAANLLGRQFALNGVVQRGDGRGAGIGFPTANLGSIETLVPACGVYAAVAELPDQSPLRAAVNIGHVPTVADQRPLTVEAHLLDFDGDIYGEPLRLRFVERLRGEQRFADLDALREQIARDVVAVAELPLE